MANGIRGRIFTWLLIAIVPVLSVALISTSVVEDRVADGVLSELANLQRVEAQRVERDLMKVTSDADRLSRATFVQLFTTQVARAQRGEPVEGQLGGQAGFDVIDPNSEAPLEQVAVAIKDAALGAGTSIVEAQVVGLDGRPLGSSSGFSWESPEPSLLPAVLDDGQARFGRAFRSAGETRIGLMTPIVSADGDIVGALLSEVALDPIISQFEVHHAVGDTSEALLLQTEPDGSARYVSELRFDSDGFGTVVPPDSVVAQAARSDRQFVGEGRDYLGFESVYTGARIAGTDLAVVMRLDSAEAFGISESIRTLVLLGSLLAIVALLVGWALVLRPLVRRVHQTAQAADRVASGDYTSRIDDRTQDEIGEVARGIDRLAADLEFDVRMRTDAERRLRYQATHDELTKIYNRQHMTSLIRASLESKEDESVSLLFLDLDDFKLVNDLWGHAVGDEVLAAVANRLRRLVGDDVLISRWGGDEFTVVVKNADPATVNSLAHRVRSLFSQPINTTVGPHPMSCSVGVSTAFDGDDLDKLLHDADAKMFEEKQANRKSRMIAPETARLVETALSDGRLEVHYQPIVTLLSPTRTELAAVEALVRIRAIDGSLRHPGEFLPEVLSHRYAREIDRTIAMMAMQDLCEWRRAGLVTQQFQLALNLSPASMRDPGLAEWLRDVAETTGADPNVVVLEMSEEADDLDEDVHAELRAIGFRFAVDDLGLKRSNFDRLLRGSVEIAKLDRRWLEHPSVLDAMIRVCRDNDLTVIAEGIETMDQLQFVFAHGVRMCQGYLVARPCSNSDFVAMLTAGRVPPGQESTPDTPEALTSDGPEALPPPRVGASPEAAASSTDDQSSPALAT